LSEIFECLEDFEDLEGFLGCIWIIVAATTLGGTLVELQLSEWTLFMKIKSNNSRSIGRFSVHLGFHNFFIVGCRICQALGRLTHIPSQDNIVVSILVEEYIGA